MRVVALLIPAMLLVPATQPPPPADSASPTSTANPFLPENENVTDCLSSLPQPGCGSDERGDLRQILTFAVLMLGMAFVGWRIALGVRRRDRAMSAADPSRNDT